MKCRIKLSLRFAPTGFTKRWRVTVFLRDGEVHSDLCCKARWTSHFTAGSLKWSLKNKNRVFNKYMSWRMEFPMHSSPNVSHWGGKFRIKAVVGKSLRCFLLWRFMLNHFSHVWLCAMLWTVARQLSMRFSRQEYWSVLPFPSPEDLPNPGLKLASLTPTELAGAFFTTSATWEVPGERGIQQILRFFLSKA